MNEVTPVWHDHREGIWAKPYTVNVNGKTLVDSLGRRRWYKDSFAAAVAGAKEVDRLRRSRREKP